MPTDGWERMDRDAWAQWAAERVARTVTLAGARTRAGARALEALGMPVDLSRWPEDLAKLPLLRKGDLPSLQAADPPFAGWLAAPQPLRRIFVSPGPIYDPEAHGPDAWGFVPALRAAGFEPGDLVLNTFAYHLTPAGHMCDGALEALGCVTIPAGTGNTEIQARTIRDLGVRGFIGTPSFLATILERLNGTGDRSTLRIAFVSGEMLTDRLRREIEDQGVRVGQGYATADVGLIAYECEQRTGLHLSSRVYVEIVDPETAGPLAPGEPGEVVVTFLSETYPLLRLATGDVSAIDPSPCPCGRGTPRLTRVMGRVGEAVKVRGMFVHPAEVRFAMSRFGEVGRYQLVVTREGHRDRVRVRMEVAPGADEAALTAMVAAHLRDAIKVRVESEVVGRGEILADAPLIVDERRWES